jgi:hypothetical protein
MQIIRRDTDTEHDPYAPDGWRYGRNSVAIAPFYEYYDYFRWERSDYNIKLGNMRSWSFLNTPLLFVAAMHAYRNPKDL